jgi:hypothetical protein
MPVVQYEGKQVALCQAKMERISRDMELSEHFQGTPPRKMIPIDDEKEGVLTAHKFDPRRLN